VRRLSLALANDRREISRLADFAQQFGDVEHLSSDEVMRIRLVLDEVVANVIKHGYEDIGDTAPHDIHVRLALSDDDVLTIEVEDDARAYDPRQAPAPRFDLPVEERRAGGLGVHIVKAIMDRIDYRREHGHNILTITRKLERLAS
jgi:anti-sigma regulatory factor (Ser/Thr protein kinase)